MAVWPSTIPRPDYNSSGSVYKPAIRPEFESGAVQSRPRATSAKKRWTLNWNALPEAEYQTLEAFFIANQGLIFAWTEPVAGQSYNVRFGMDEIVGEYAFFGHRSTTVTLWEA